MFLFKDCTAPFQVHIRTDGLGDGSAAGAAPVAYSRGMSKQNYLKGHHNEVLSII